ncbi:hypothetical protein HDU81_004617 [Chytriomyces hyalinus]|nr:hypothetical protein HDU81_004617 [Chytriomyces hyalinus]
MSPKTLLNSSVWPIAISALLNAIAVGSYGWFYVLYPNYHGSYGVFYAKGCSGTFCQTEYLACEHAWYCAALKAFRFFAVMSSLCSGVGAVLTFYYMGFLYNKPVVTKRTRLIKVSCLILMATSTLLQFLTVVCFGVFKNQAGNDSYNDFNSENGRFGFSFVFMIVGMVLLSVGTPVFYYSVFRGVSGNAQLFNNARFAGRSWRGLNDAIAQGADMRDPLLDQPAPPVRRHVVQTSSNL